MGRATVLARHVTDNLGSVPELTRVELTSHEPDPAVILGSWCEAVYLGLVAVSADAEVGHP
jgi:hypothetical protein